MSYKSTRKIKELRNKEMCSHIDMQTHAGRM